MPVNKPVLRVVLLFSAVLLLLHAPAGAAVAKLTILSLEQERLVGEETLKELRKEFGLYDGLPALQSYLDGIASKLGAQSQRKELAWKMQVLDTPHIYSFSLPGGTICVSRGFLAQLRSEGETAAAISHEVAHQALRHCDLRVTGSELSDFIKGTLSDYSQELLLKMDGAVNLSLGLALCGYLPGQEAEADAEGLLVLQKAGYDPYCAVSLYKNLLELEAVAPGKVERYLLNHPPTQGRLDKAQLVAATPGAATPECGSAAHAKACSGLPLGKAEGDEFYNDGVYTNRRAAVRLTLPPDFEAHFAPPSGEVRFTRMVKPGKGYPAELLLEVAQMEPGSTRDIIADKYIVINDIKRATVGDRGFKADDGRPISLRIFNTETKEGYLRTFLAVAAEGDRAFVMRATAHIDRYATDIPALMGAIKSLKLLTPDEAAAATQPKMR